MHLELREADELDVALTPAPTSNPPRSSAAERHSKAHSVRGVFLLLYLFIRVCIISRLVVSTGSVHCQQSESPLHTLHHSHVLSFGHEQLDYPHQEVRIALAEFATMPFPIVTRDESRVLHLTALVQRLEAATSRLEDIAQSTGDFKAAPHTALAPTASPAATALSVPTASPQPTIREPPAAVKEDLPASVVEFDTIVEDDITVFEKISKKLGDVVAKQVCGACARCSMWA